MRISRQGVRWLKDHPGEKVVPEKVRQNLSNVKSVIAVFGTGGIFAGVAFLAIGYAVGWVLGGPTADTRPVMGLGTAQRLTRPRHGP